MQRQPAVAPRRPRGHRHGDEDHLADLLVGGAGLRRARDVRLDAPRALRDVGDAERHQLLGLEGQSTGRERLAVELEEAPVGLRRKLAHPLELLLHVDAVKHHAGLLPGGFCFVYTSRARVAALRGASL